MTVRVDELLANTLSGQAGAAAIVVDADEFKTDGLLPWLQGKLASYAVPRFIRIVDSLAVTGTFKVQKAELRKAGCDLDVLPADAEIYWLEGAGYSKFSRREFEMVKTGKAKI